MTDVCVAHYVYNQALTQLLRGEQAKFVWTPYSLAAYGQAQGNAAGGDPRPPADKIRQAQARHAER
jgi:hypothetical protein